MTLYDEINALGGAVDPKDERAAGRMENLDDVLAILDRRAIGREAIEVPVAEIEGCIADIENRDARSALIRLKSILAYHFPNKGDQS